MERKRTSNPDSIYFKNRMENIQNARKQIKSIEEDPIASALTKWSIEHSEFFRSIHREYLDCCALVNYEAHPKIYTIPESTVNAIFRPGDPATRHDVVLNFADFKTPGGMFLEGSMAQEESLCHSSNLYNILSSKGEFSEHYERNAGILNDYCTMYSSASIYVPSVFFKKNDESTCADVIVLAAPNNRRRKHLNSEGIIDISEEMYRLILRMRIESIFKTAYRYFQINNKITKGNLNHFSATPDREEIPEKNCLILGAFGCGVFRNDPNLVSKIMVDCINNGYGNMFDEIIFAIPPGKNFDIFNKAIINGIKF